MNECIHKYMKVGLIHFMAYPESLSLPVEETVRAIALDEYFDAIEITSIRDAGVRARVKAMLETSHITVAWGAQPQLLGGKLNINHLEEPQRRKAVEVLKAGIDEAFEMGATGFAFLSGPYRQETREQSFRALVGSVKEVCAYAKALGPMSVVLEQFDHEIDKKSLIGPAALALRLAREVAASFDNFGLLVDLSHLPLIGEPIPETLRLLGDHIVHAHLGNCVMKRPGLPAYGDAHPRFGFPDGENDVEQVAGFLRGLLEIGFLDPQNPPVVSFEIRPFGGEDPALVIANAKRVLTRAWALV